MTSLFKRLQRLLRRSEPSESAKAGVDSLLEGVFSPLRTSDPDTHRQWARLNVRIATEHSGSPANRPRLATGLAFAVVATAAAIVFVTTREPLTDRYITARGEQTRIFLPDSSGVTLNHTSELSVRRFEPGEPRRLTLSGEALFHVRNNATPFIVSNGFAHVTVVGTEFNVRSREEVLEVAVLHGTVTVTGTDGAPSTVTLIAGQRAIVRRGSIPARIDDIPSPDFPGWMQGKLYLTRASLEEACREVEARFDVSVRISGPSPSAITGLLEASSADAALRSLSLLTGKELRRDHETYVLE
jgi:ferric-dicitrate binding protein FerR (iron transport regulator)